MRDQAAGLAAIKTDCSNGQTEALDALVVKVRQNRSLFPNDEAVFKLLYLAVKNIEKKWTMPIRDWKQALQQFAIMLEGECRYLKPLTGYLHKKSETFPAQVSNSVSFFWHKMWLRFKCRLSASSPACFAIFCASRSLR